LRLKEVVQTGDEQKIGGEKRKRKDPRDEQK